MGATHEHTYNSDCNCLKKYNFRRMQNEQCSNVIREKIVQLDYETQTAQSGLKCYQMANTLLLGGDNDNEMYAYISCPHVSQM